MKILITGGSGLLGQYLNLELSRRYDILTLYNANPGNCTLFNSQRIDLCQLNQLEDIFKSFKPDLVVHTASISKTDLADQLPREYVIRVNVEVTHRLAVLCSRYGSRLFYTSTDLVYDGTTGSMLNETSPVKPVSFYAETKLQAEKKIEETFEKYIILRTALLYGFGLNHSGSHFSAVYSNLKEGRPVRLFYDQYRTPLSLMNAAQIIAELAETDIKTEIINFGGKERVSRFDLGMILCSEAGFDNELIIGISMDDAVNIPRVPDVSMDTKKLRSLGIKQHTVRESIRKILSEVRS